MWINEFLQPNLNGHTHQGKFIPSNPEKYIGDVGKIIYRSGWEFDFLKWCDTTPSIIKYGAEAMCVTYINPIDMRQHRYFVDMYMEMLLSDNTTVVKWLIEVKPREHTEYPKRPRKLTTESRKKYRKACELVEVNIAKFRAAKSCCESNDMMFGVVCMNRKTRKFEFIEWVDDVSYVNPCRVGERSIFS